MKKVLVKGPMMTQSGYGEHTRYVLRALRSREDLFDIYAHQINWGKTNWVWANDEEREWIDSILEKTAHYAHGGGQFDMSVQVTIPNEWEKIAPVNVGVTAGVEVNRVTPQWIEKSQVVDRIITISEHSKQVYENSSYTAQNNETGEVFNDFRVQVPIEVVHYPVKTITPEPMGLELDTDFNFLLVAQWGPRKNVENTIKWFVEEFIDQEVGLVVKCNLMKNCIYDRIHIENRIKHLLQAYPDRKCKVYSLHGSLTDEQMASLYQEEKIKSLVSLTHGEGFGLPIFEAAYSGMPIIAPAWSGHVDFLYMPVKDKKGKVKKKPMFATVEYDIVPIPKEVVWEGVIPEGSMWCDAQQGSFKMRLREVYKDYGRFKSRAKKLQEYICEEFEEQKQLALMIEKISGEKTVKVNIEDLPKLSIITSVFNGDEYIEGFLEDVTGQTIFKEKCELILINANSPGNEEETILKYKEKYPDNIVYKKLDEDPGIYAVWNMGVEMSTGEFLTNANLDDRKASNQLEMLSKQLFSDPEVDLVYADMLITDKPNETFEDNSSSGRKYTFPEFSFDNLKMVNMPHASPVWRKSLHDEHGLFDEKYGSAGDWEMWLRASSQGSKMKKAPGILGLYYFNPTGISTNPDNFDWKRKEEKGVFEKYQNVRVS